jgi:hypothetical protein
VRRVDRAYNRPKLALRTAKRLQLLWARWWVWPSARCWRSSSSWWRRRGRGCSCGGGRRSRCTCCRSGSSCRRRCSWRRSWSSPCLAEFFHRGHRDAGTVVAARQPNPRCAVRVGGEVAPGGRERRNRGTCCPSVTPRIVDVHLGGWIGRDSPATHDIHLVILPPQWVECFPIVTGQVSSLLSHSILDDGGYGRGAGVGRGLGVGLGRGVGP